MFKSFDIKTPVLDFRLGITAFFENRGARTPRRICRLKFRWLRKTCNNIERRHDIKKLNFAYEHFLIFVYHNEIRLRWGAKN